MELFPILFGIIFLAIFAVITAVVTPRQNLKRQTEYMNLAERFGFTLINQPNTGLFAGVFYPRIEGTLNGMPVSIEAVKTGSGKNRRYWTVLQVYTGYEGGDTFKVSKSNVFKQIGKALGAQDVEVGDREFDEAFIVKASDESLASWAISPDVRDKFLKLVDDHPSISAVKFKNGYLHFRDLDMRITRKKEALLARVLDVMVAIGTNLKDGESQGRLHEGGTGDIFS